MYAYYIICILDTLPKKPSPPKTELLRSRFSTPQLLRLFLQLLPASDLDAWLAASGKTFYGRAFTPLITLWYIVFQRLGDNHHLSRVLEDAREGGADGLSPRGKKLSNQLLSESTSSYSDARQRLPLHVCRQALRHTADQIEQAFGGPRRFGRKVALLDGSTYRLRPFGDIPKQFPAHRPGNCKRAPYWCVTRVVGLLSWATGAVLDTAIGSLKASEQALSAELFELRSYAGWLVLGDRNFGVFSVLCAIVASGGDALVRMTQQRAARLARGCGLKLKPGLDALVTWSPSCYDHCPAWLKPVPLQGRLLAVQVRRPGFRDLTLYLFTTLCDERYCPTQELVELYAQRWNIEVCFRYIKTQMELGFLECRSAEIARKEWFAGLIAYNLIRWPMAAAAATHQVPLPLLSFSRARELFLGWLARSPMHRRNCRSWERLLTRISKARLPRRRKRRPAEPRAVRPFRKDHVILVGSRQLARKQLAKTRRKS